MACYRIERGAIILSVRLTPRGGRDAIEGIATLADGREVLKARVRAIPEKGKANAALLAALARYLGVPKTALSVVAGINARLKDVRVEGDPERLAAIVAAEGRV